MFGVAVLTDEVVAAATAGSNEAAARIAHALAPQVRVMVTGRVCATPHQAHAVEDITQQVMIGINNGMSRLENRTVAGLAGYTSRIVSNKVVDFLKSQRPTHGSPPVASLDSTVAGASGTAPMWQFLSASGRTPLSEAARADERDRVLHKLAELDEKDREIITLAFFDQLQTGQIAEQLGVSRPAAAMRLLRAVNALRRSLTGSSRIVQKNDHDS
jgi:RNA polymerase sigma factor (sigma-70 family)